MFCHLKCWYSDVLMTSLLQASGSWDKTIRLWRARDGSLLFVLNNHTGWVRALAFSPDGTILASTSDDESVRVLTFFL